jgi:hypothetical protein
MMETVNISQTSVNFYKTRWCNIPEDGPSGHAVWGVGLDHFNAETVGLNPALGMDVCPCLLIIIIHLSLYNNAI